MAEGRMLKRRITLSKKMAALKTDKARLLWFYMLPFTDVEGRIEADPEDLGDEILRKQRKGFTPEKIQEYLEDLHRVGLIVLYNDENGQYLEFTRFSDEQRLRRDKEAESKIPAPLPDNSGTTPAISKENVKESISISLSKENNTEKRARDSDFDSGRMQVEAGSCGQELGKILRPSTKSDRKALANVCIWAYEQVKCRGSTEDIFDRVIEIARESKSAKKPIAAFFARMKKELSYNPRHVKEGAKL